jgi:hypothetical protein
MDGADPSELARRDDLIRRQMAERTERQGWVHHVVDGDTGEVLTTPLDRPLAPLSRAERLARLGHGVPSAGSLGTGLQAHCEEPLPGRAAQLAGPVPRGHLSVRRSGLHRLVAS